MSSRDDSNLNTENPKHPADTDNILLRWDSNDAKITGLLEDFNKFCVRVGKHQLLFKHRACSTSSGKIAVKSISTIPYITGELDDDCSFIKICPDIDDRVAATDAARAAAGEPSFKWPKTNTASEFIVNSFHVDKDDAQLLTLLEFVFGNNASEDSDELMDDAAGSGLALIEALRARAAGASTADKAIITAHFDRTKSEGITGELNLTSLKAFLTKYKKAKRDLPTGQRPSPDTEVQMIQQIAFKDRSLYELFELKKDIKDPKTLDATVAILKSILTSRSRADELDQAISGAQPTLAEMLLVC